MKEVIIFAFLSAQALNIFTTSGVKFRPPGTVAVVDNFFVDEREIRNIDWKEYLISLEKDYGKNSQVYIDARPDTTVWQKEGYDLRPYADNYFQNPAYDEYPVVGVSYQQAIEYCNWRTEAVNDMLILNKISGPKAFKYRLPTQAEWELIASVGLSKKQKKLQSKANKKYNYPDRKLGCNMKHHSYGDNSVTTQYAPSPSVTNLPNKLGVYNIYGNVAEMVAQKGVAMGGSYIHYYEDIVPSNKEILYDQPNPWLGFRCVCEIYEN